MSEQFTATHERVDDIPVIIAFLLQMRVAELIDKCFPTNGNWTGLSLGEMIIVWLTFILSEGDHRLYHVESWVADHQQTLSRCLGRQIEPRDCTDDRLAAGLDYLAVTENWAECETELNQSVIRLYDLNGRLARLDSTTVAAYVTPDGLFQLGHSKDHRPDLPQLKISLSVLDPLGLPLTVTVVAGNTADDPLYLPEIAKLRQSFNCSGLTHVGDCKLAALATRADIAAHSDFYLCPLSAKQMPAEELDQLLEPVWSKQQPLSEIRLEQINGQAGAAETADEIDEDSALIAVGFEYSVELSGQDQSGNLHLWQERRLVVRSLALAQSQERGLRQRAARASAEIKALNERKQGKKRLTDKASAREAAQAIIERHRVAEVVEVTVKTETHKQPKRRYGNRPATTVSEQRIRVQATINQAALEQAVRRLGWRLYATNHDAATLSLEQAVGAYRSEYLIEQGFRRLKGRPLSLAPMYLQYEHRNIGLIFLMTLALRVLVLIQFVARRKLEKEGATLKGIYPGQPGRQTTKPTTEMMLRIFRGITLSKITINGQTSEHLTPLNNVQRRILELLGLPLETYSWLIPKMSKTDFHSRET
jgi:transposase